MAGYDANKAATYNKLRQQGLSEDAAAGQAGITLGDTNYVISGKYNADGTKNANPGAMGADIQGSNKVAGVDYDNLTAAEVAESSRFDRGLASSSNFEQVDFQVEAKNPPGKVTPINYTTTSTETVSGGGSTSVVAGPRVPTAASQALQPEITAKQAELNQYVKDNPSDFARKKQGLPPLSPAENDQRLEKINQLNSESNALKRKQIDAEAATPPTTTTVPNTTTTEKTVTTGITTVNQEVDPTEDEKVSQDSETQLDANSPTAANASTATGATPIADGPGAGRGFVNPPVVNPDAPAPEPVADGPGAGAGRGFVNPPVVNPDAPAPEPVAEAGAGRGFVNPPVVTPDVSTPAPVENPPDDATGIDQQVAANAAAPVETQLTPAQTEAALDQARIDATPSAADVQAADDKSLQDIEDIRKEQVDAPGGVTFPDTNNDSTAAATARAKSQGTLQSRYKQPGNGDWRVRLSLAPNSDYLYNATKNGTSDAGVLAPLTATNGVIFPYTPTITTNYTADYAKESLTHSNYRSLFYKSSSVGEVQIKGTFTAQDTQEAAYMLAVIHFFKSVTKMFYGQDAERGTPPPLVYLSGYGDLQYSNHSCVVSSFNYSLPNEVDYIRTNAPNNFGLNMSNRQLDKKTSPGGGNFSGAIRLANALLNKGAMPQLPAQNALRSYVNNTNECTYVPTRMEIDITLIPVQTRSQVSKQFSLREFANGNLLKKGFW